MSLVIIFLIFDYWNKFVRPAWQQTMNPTTFLIVTVLFFGAVFLIFAVILQPLLYATISDIMNPNGKDIEVTDPADDP